MMSKIANDK
jgi:hypothetical protein